MILYINAKLNTWSDWVASGRKVVGLGYPSQVAFMRLTPSSNSLREPILNEEAWEIEQAVQRLDAQLREVVDQFYLHAGTAESHAKALHICRDTLYSRLHAAHLRIMDWLQVGDDEYVQKKFLTCSDTLATKHVR
jgi:DNA-directed RNA polymerase specialized sigma24 family protein